MRLDTYRQQYDELIRKAIPNNWHPKLLVVPYVAIAALIHQKYQFEWFRGSELRREFGKLLPSINFDTAFTYLKEGGWVIHKPGNEGLYRLHECGLVLVKRHQHYVI